MIHLWSYWVKILLIFLGRVRIITINLDKIVLSLINLFLSQYLNFIVPKLSLIISLA